MKTLIIHDYLTAYGGAESVLLDLLEIFPDADILTSQYFPKDLNSNFADKFNSHKIYTTFLQFLPSSKKILSVYRKLAFIAFFLYSILNHKIFSNYDLVICNTSGPATWLVKRFFKTKVFCYAHKIPSFSFAENKNLLQKILHKLNSHFVRQIDVLITNSKFNQACFKNIFDKDSTVIYPKVEIRKLSKKETENYFIYIGRLESYKGIMEIVETCIELNLNLKVIGKGSLSGKLPSSKYVEYLGFVSELEKFNLLNHARAFLTAGGVREEFGITAIESLLCKTPIIALKKGGVVELVKEFDGKIGNSILFDNLTHVDLKRAIVEFLSLEEKFKSNFAEIDQDKFSFERFKNEVLNLTN